MRPNMVSIQMKLSLLVILLVDFFQSIVGIDFTFQIIVFDRKEYRCCTLPLVTLWTPQGKLRNCWYDVIIVGLLRYDFSIT